MNKTSLLFKLILKKTHNLDGTSIVKKEVYEEFAGLVDLSGHEIRCWYVYINLIKL